MSQNDLAKALNVTRQSISKWEMGESLPQVDKVMELCRLFKVSADDLLNDDILSDPSNTQQRQIVDSLYNCTSANAIFYTLQTTTPRIIPEKAEFDKFKDTC